MQHQRLEIVRQGMVSTARTIVDELELGDTSPSLERMWAEAGLKETRIVCNPAPADIDSAIVRRIHAAFAAAGAYAPEGLRQAAFKPETLGTDLKYLNIVDPVPDGDFRFAIYGDGVAANSTAKLQSSHMSDLAMRPQSGPGPAFFSGELHACAAPQLRCLHAQRHFAVDSGGAVGAAHGAAVGHRWRSADLVCRRRRGRAHPRPRSDRLVAAAVAQLEFLGRFAAQIVRGSAPHRSPDTARSERLVLLEYAAPSADNGL